MATLPAISTSWEDVNVNVGEAFEYQIYKTNSVYPNTGNGYIFAGIEYPATENKGALILIVDSTYSSYLSEEIKRLETDMICDGWQVIRHDVDRNDNVQDIKAIILNDVNTHPSVKSVFLLGHVPVPYSGNINPDGHSNHKGAWPADLYYGELNGVWTDQSINNTTASRSANHNIPGDGKFDQSIIPSDVDLEVGRVDLYNMPAFSLGDADLIKQYLDKNHNFRRGVITALPRGLVDDHFTSYTEAFAANGWKNFSAMFGASNVFALDYFSTMTNNSYLWSYGCGGGTYTSAGGIGNTGNFASDSVQTIFTVLFGSYFGDWDCQNNFMRAPLASSSPALLCFWAGRPNWYFHHMALGDHMGFSTRLSQNNASLYYAGASARNIHVALMGDPTLRMHVVGPPEGLFAGEACESINLNWLASSDTVLGYNIYRSDSLNGYFIKINNSIIIDTFYSDDSALAGKKIYMVRAVKLESHGSGSYYNLSAGVIDSAIVYTPLALSYSNSNIQCYGNSDGIIDLNVSGGKPFYNYLWSNGASTEDLVDINAGTYYLSVSDNANCVANDTILLTEPDEMLLSFIVLPDVGGACIGEASSVVSGGTLPYTYLWDDPGQQTTPDATGLCAGWYILTVLDSNGCMVSDSVLIENQNGVNVNGHVYYDNILSTIMPEVYVDLYDAYASVLISDTTDILGEFLLSNVQPGNYLLSASTVKAWGGVNSTDALAIMQHFVGINILNGLRLEAADVNSTGYVNAADALYTQQRYIGMVSAFPAGDYVFSNENINIGTANVNKDIFSICYGDVNASYFPPLQKYVPSVNLLYKDTLFVELFREYEVPLRLENSLSISAISLQINYPDDLLEITGVRMEGDNNSSLLFNTENGQLNISWYNLNPLELVNGQILLYLNCVCKSMLEVLEFEISDNSEFACHNALPIRNVEISLPRIVTKIAADPEIIISMPYPNPSGDYTQIDYFISDPGTIECTLYNVHGEIVSDKYIYSHSKPGRYNMVLKVTELASGMIFCKIIYRSKSSKKIKLLRVIVEK
ncbi:MAG: hypothetical protein GY746_01640 [Gammaproteobacteria bacterium]|nr:hypothetical protein [Gammaproteobacteria bacterium]